MTFFFRDAGVVTAAEEKDTGRVVRVVSGGRTVNGRSDEDIGFFERRGAGK
jgi:hypothetical protein